MQFERVADKKRLDFIIEAVRHAVPSGGAILDIGCGNGIITRELGVHGYRVTGIDSSEETIKMARSFNTLPNVEFRVVLAEGLSNEATRYDATICSEVLEHLHKPGELLTTIHELLKDTGILVVTVPNGIGPRELLVTRPVQYLQKKNNLIWKLLSAVKNRLGYTGTTVQSAAGDLTHIQFFTKASLERLASISHFRIVQFSNANFIEQVFPFSLLTKRSRFFQRLDFSIGESLPHHFTSGFMSVWKKKGNL